LPPLQFSWKLLKNLWRNIQSSMSLPLHLLKYTSIKHCHFGSNCGAATIHPQRQTMSHRNRSRTWEDTSNQARAFTHTSQNTHWSNIAISEAIEAPLPFTHNAKRSLTIRLLPPPQFLRKLLENLQRHIQSSMSLPLHLLKHT
jgi:hypothetical protein